MIIAEGSRVSYIGWNSREGLEINDSGKVLASSSNASHVMLTTGKRSGDVVLILNNDLVITRHTAGASELDDSLSEGTLVHTAARETFDRYGSVGLINALATEGVLSNFDAFAEEAVGLVAARIRHDPVIRTVLADLDEDEAEQVVQTATATLLRDAFGEL